MNTILTNFYLTYETCNHEISTTLSRQFNFQLNLYVLHSNCISLASYYAEYLSHLTYFNAI